MLETINDFGRKVTALYKAGQYCTFAPPEETIGIIDTSPDHDGSRGIAFLCDEIRTNFGSGIRHIGYKQVCSVKIHKSYETTFDDELEIEAPNCSIMITDCSLNKFFLRQLINSMCRIYYTMREEQRAELRASCTAAAAEHFAGEIPVVNVQLEEAAHKPLHEPVKEEVPAAIPEGKIHWLSSAESEQAVAAEIAEEARASQQAAEAVQAEPAPEKQLTEDDLLSASDLPEDMSHDEAMSYLLDSINEINSDVDADEPASAAPTEQPCEAVQDMPAAVEAAAAQAAPQEPPKPRFTEEPVSDDIYIKASRRIRQFCEENLLTMTEVEDEVKQSMVTVAESYSALAAEGNIPPAIAQRVETLKSATDRLTEYFALGEDIAARVMFFMLYQMLSYSDRIAEQPETKENLNNFFRRYGSAGMALSLLDSGI